MLKVLHVRSSSFLGSPEKLILAQIFELGDRVESQLAVLPDGDSQYFYEAAGQGGVETFRPENLRSFSQIIRNGSYDVVVSHDYKSNFYSWRSAGRAKRIAVFHGRTSHDLKSRFYEWIDDFLLETKDAVVAVSEATARDLAFLTVPVTVIRNACPQERSSRPDVDLRDELGIPGDTVVYATAGRLSVEKAHDHLIGSFHSALRASSRLFLVIAGEGPERERLDQRIEDLGVESRVRMLGFVEDMTTLYEMCDVFVLPSDREGLPLVILEAGSHGVPVISSHVGGVAEVVKHGESGLLVPPRDQEALSRAMVDLAVAKAKRREMGEALRRHVQEKFSTKDYANSFLRLYERVWAPSSLWISWEVHRRSRDTAKALGFDLVEILNESPRWRRYPFLLSRTWRLIRRRRPHVLVVQSPSVILAFFAGMLKNIYGYTLVVDAHNESVVPYNFNSAIYKWVIRRIHRMADRVLVTNTALEPIVEGHGGTPFVLPNSVPDLSPIASCSQSSSTKHVVFICTFSPDEPYREVLSAAAGLPSGTVLVVTGDHRKAGPQLVKEAPGNVQFLGYVNDEDYIRAISHADVILDLTDMQDCLVTGAYEAVAVERPLVTSDTKALRETFHRGTIYTGHEPAQLTESMHAALSRGDSLRAEMVEMKSELQGRWKQRKDRLLEILFGD